MYIYARVGICVNVHNCMSVCICITFYRRILKFMQFSFCI